MEVLIVGVTPDGFVKPISVDRSSSVLFTLARSHGWYAAGWYKNPLQLGYSGTIEGVFSNLNLPAGTSNLDSTAVPANTVWVVEMAAVSYVGTMTNVRVEIKRRTLVGDVILQSVNPTMISGAYYGFVLQATLKAGDFVRATVYNATLNNDLYLTITGRKIDLVQ